MEILDTQVISYAFKGTYNRQVIRQHISSITAKEFLLVQSTETAKVNYYVPLPSRLKLSPEDDWDFPKRDHPFTRTLTDQIILEFGQDYPAMSEYGNFAIAEMINQRQKRLFNETIRFLSKEMRKTILHRFDFLLEQEIGCVPLNRNRVEIGLGLFSEFVSQYTAKQNHRNTVYDILILATAIDLSAVLFTRDSLLNRFASEQFQSDFTENTDILSIDFSRPKSSEKRRKEESKGYINKGWRVSLKNYQGAW